LLLILLGVFLSSNWSKQTDWVFVNVLCQIGLGYAFVFLLLGKGFKVQLAAAVTILVGYWLAFLLYPLPGADFNSKAVGLPPDWDQLTGLFAHWNKNTNLAAAFDVWFLNLFPREKPFQFNTGGYQTLNFVPSMATMIFGIMAGEWLRGERSHKQKVLGLFLAGALCLGLGWLLGETLCPIVKRIWTPSWAVFSAGWTFWMLAAFYWVIDVQGYQRWSFPLVVVGMNSIVMYCMAQLIKPWVKRTLEIHCGATIFTGVYGPILASVSVLFVLWLVCWWMYRQKVFVRI
jgi:predicted acyltransferase